MIERAPFLQVQLNQPLGNYFLHFRNFMKRLFYNYVLRNFTSLVTRSKGPGYVDYDEKFVEYELR